MISDDERAAANKSSYKSLVFPLLLHILHYSCSIKYENKMGSAWLCLMVMWWVLWVMQTLHHHQHQWLGCWRQEGRCRSADSWCGNYPSLEFMAKRLIFSKMEVTILNNHQKFTKQLFFQCQYNLIHHKDSLAKHNVVEKSWCYHQGWLNNPQNYETVVPVDKYLNVHFSMWKANKSQSLNANYVL